jgi:hypothetical protein
MDITGRQPIFFSRPADRSLDAFKGWISEMMLALGGTQENNITEQEWQDAWQKFWASSTPDKAVTKEQP